MIGKSFLAAILCTAYAVPVFAETIAAVTVYEARNEQYWDVWNETFTPVQEVSGTGGGIFPDVNVFGRAVSNYGRIEVEAGYTGQMVRIEADITDTSYSQPRVTASGNFYDYLTINAKQGSSLVEGASLLATSRFNLSGSLTSNLDISWPYDLINTSFRHDVVAQAGGSLFGGPFNSYFLDGGTFLPTSYPIKIDGLTNSWNLDVDYAQWVSVGSGFDLDVGLYCTISAQATNAPQVTTIDSGCGPMTLTWKGMTFVDDNFVDRTGELDAFGDSGTNWALAYSASGAIPEPASWAMMVAGFGLVGASIRKRRVTAALPA